MHMLKAHGDLSPAMQRQLALEQEMFNGGIERYRDQVLDARQKGREAETQYGNKLLRLIVQPVSEAIAEFMEKARTGKGGRRHTAVKFFNLLDPDKIALIASRTIVNGITREVGYQTLAVSIAAGLEDEVRFSSFSEAAPGMFFKVTEDLNRRTSNRPWKRAVLAHSMNKLELDWEDWPQEQKFHVGSKCIDLFIQATGLIEVRTYAVSAKKRKTIVKATEDAAKLIEETVSRSESLFPDQLPMLVPPRPWTSPRGGGYHFLPRKMPLVKHAKPYLLEEMANRPEQMAQVYEAINVMQDVAWKINQPVLDTLIAVWDRGLAVGKLPNRHNEDIPPKPHDIETNEESRTEWRRLASKAHDRNTRAFSSRVQVAQTISLAKRFREEPEIFFPWQLDFRGRAYTVSSFLNPQASDWAKALLTFAEGKPIRDERALGWLMIHGANCWGEDKVSLGDRVGWVSDHEDRILAVATDPLGERWWTEADEPFGFLAFCFEYAAFQAEGYGFVSHLPCAMDGSCNGLQHFSAMLRDEVGGAEVNLVPNETPHDIYQRVADVVVQKLSMLVDRADTCHCGGVISTGGGCVARDGVSATCMPLASEAEEQAAEMAQQWLMFGIDRDLTKRPVMVLPYGGTPRSCRAYVLERLEKMAEKKPCPWDGEQRKEAAGFLSSIVWESIGEVVIGAKEAMKWLRKLASAASKEGLPITWTTPDGLPVVQAYAEIRSRQIDTKLGDRVIKPVLATETDKLNSNRQRDGISPNFVHSMDAAAMRLYVNLAYENGIENFALVHDSFGVLAADAEASAACLRHAFVDMYEQYDVLGDFMSSVMEVIPEKRQKDIPPPPPPGTLDISSVRESAYFFA